MFERGAAQQADACAQDEEKRAHVPIAGPKMRPTVNPITIPLPV
jgi:hypothetical protein